jgi:hypothetical protein
MPPGHYPNSPVNHQAQLGLLVADLFRENGWKVLHQPREQNSAPDLIASRPAKKLIIEIKRVSEGRRDRVIALLSQAALEAAYYSRNFAGNPIPVAIVGANHISDSVSEEAKEFVRKRAPEVAVGLLDFEGLRSFAGHGLEDLSSERRAENSQSLPKLRARAPQLFLGLEPMDAEGSPGSPNSRIVSVCSARTVSRSFSAAGGRRRIGHECILLRGTIFEGRVPRLWVWRTSRRSIERTDEPLAGRKSTSRRRNSHARGSAQGEKSARERTSFLRVGGLASLP